MESLSFELMEERQITLSSLLNFSIQFLFKKAIDNVNLSLDKIMKQSLETPRREVVNVVTKVPRPVSIVPVKQPK